MNHEAAFADAELPPFTKFFTCLMNQLISVHLRVVDLEWFGLFRYFSASRSSRFPWHTLLASVLDVFVWPARWCANAQVGGSTTRKGGQSRSNMIQLDSLRHNYVLTIGISICLYIHIYSMFNTHVTCMCICVYIYIYVCIYIYIYICVCVKVHLFWKIEVCRWFWGTLGSDPSRFSPFPRLCPRRSSDVPGRRCVVPLLRRVLSTATVATHGAEEPEPTAVRPWSGANGQRSQQKGGKSWHIASVFRNKHGISCCDGGCCQSWTGWLSYVTSHHRLRGGLQDWERKKREAGDAWNTGKGRHWRSSLVNHLRLDQGKPCIVHQYLW